MPLNSNQVNKENIFNIPIFELLDLSKAGHPLNEMLTSSSPFLSSSCRWNTTGDSWVPGESGELGESGFPYQSKHPKSSSLLPESPATSHARRVYPKFEHIGSLSRSIPERIWTQGNVQRSPPCCTTLFSSDELQLPHHRSCQFFCSYCR
jgi:hypothetical protein